MITTNNEVHAWTMDMNNRAPLWLNISPKAVSSWKIKKKCSRREKR